jgi:hypothetical protein
MNVRKSIEQALVDARESTGKEFVIEKLVIKFESDVAGNTVVLLSELHLKQTENAD